MERCLWSGSSLWRGGKWFATVSRVTSLKRALPCMITSTRYSGNKNLNRPVLLGGKVYSSMADQGAVGRRQTASVSFGTNEIGLKSKHET
jgi:hypothetical protein